MTIVQVEQNRLRQQEIEVRALTALAKSGSKPQKYMACKRLEEIAYPEKLADKINTNYKQRRNLDYWGNVIEK